MPLNLLRYKLILHKPEMFEVDWKKLYAQYQVEASIAPVYQLLHFGIQSFGIIQWKLELYSSWCPWCFVDPEKMALFATEPM